MKEPYIAKGIYEQTVRLIDLQRQGKFLVSPNDPERDAPPIPTMKELGLRRARYPYDYETDWGRFKMDYAASVLTLIDGTPPAEWAGQPALQLASAIVHPDCITLRTEDDRDPGLTLELRQEESDYRFLRRINALLRADHHAYVVWKLAWAEDDTAMETLAIANDSAMIFASSAVWSPDDTQLVAALAASSSKELLIAIRATLANNGSKGWLSIKGRSHNAYVRGAKRGFIHVSGSLAKANAAGTSAALLHPLSGNPQEERDDHFYVIATPGEALPAKFNQRLALAIAWPTQPAWAEYLLQAGQEANLVQPLPIAGPDFTAALRVVKDDTGWEAVIAQGLKSGAISI